MNRRSLLSALCAAVLSVGVPGCGKSADPASSADRATVSYDVAFLHREMSPNGPNLIQSPITESKAARPSSIVEIGNFGLKASVEVMSVEPGKATFKIAFPDGTRQQVDVKDGESKEFFEGGRSAGVRIKVHATSS
jgi:hypothetical protein